jgi:hypothetical protein
MRHCEGEARGNLLQLTATEAMKKVASLALAMTFPILGLCKAICNTAELQIQPNVCAV